VNGPRSVCAGIARRDFLLRTGGGWGALALLASLGLTVLLLFPTNRLILVGLLRHEPFYRWRPASYWRERAKEQTKILRSLPRGLLLDTQSSPPTWQHMLNDITAGRAPRLDGHLPLLQGNPAAVAVLIDLLDDPDDDVRMAAVLGLRMVGPAAEAAIPVLASLVKEGANRRGPVSAAPPGSSFVDELNRQLTNQLVRSEAARTLGLIGPAALPSVLEMLRDNDDEVRSAAMQAIREMGPEASGGIRFLGSVDRLQW
jgi:hypothetical protein